MQQKFRLWRDPEMKLRALDATDSSGRILVVASYELPALSAAQILRYDIDGGGSVLVSERLAVDP